MQSVLVTGFSNFGNVAINPSETLVTSLGREVSSLDTHIFKGYKDINSNLQVILEKYRPRVVVMFGLASKTPFVRLERFATRPKNLQGETTYSSSLPLNAIHDQLVNLGVEVKFSDNAGSYWCNYLFYKVGLALSGTNSSFGFIHIPNPDKYEKTYGKKLDLLKVGLAALEPIESQLQLET